MCGRQWMVLGALMLVLSVRAQAALPGDAEAATHGDQAAVVDLVAETAIREPDFVFRQYNLAVLSHYSYLLGSQGAAWIVDPDRDVSRYLKDAQELGLKITGIYLTHSHADFVAGHTELAKATGATIYCNAATGAGYPHKGLKDKDELRLGALRLVLITTPGHTPDGTCLLVYSGTPEPRLLLTGDTLFIGSVGRPDLMGGTISGAALAAMGYQSWTEKLALLPDATRFFPAHGAGSLCGAHLSDQPVSTIGEQKRSNPYLQHHDLHSYVTAVLTGLPQAPAYFSHNAQMNHDGPPLVDWSAAMPAALTPADVQQRAAAGTWLVDTRSGADFASGCVPGAINIGIRGRFETWFGMMIPWGAPFVLIGPDDDVREATFRLHRIGFDQPTGYLAGGVGAWKQAGLPLRTVTLVSPQDLLAQMKQGTAPVVVDVRLPSEWTDLRIAQNLLNIPLGDLAVSTARLDPTMPVVTVCNSSYRSSMAAALLLKAGFKDVRNLAGGSEAWIEDGLPTFGAAPAQCAAPAPASAGAAPMIQDIRLPDQMGVAELKRLLMDLPGTFDLVDIRPAEQFADYHVPGARNVPAAAALGDPALLAGPAPLILVDRDGTLAMAVAGALCQKTSRPVKVLFGGTEAYWRETMPGNLGTMPTLLPATPPPPAAAPVVPVTPPAAPTPPKKRSAGC